MIKLKVKTEVAIVSCNEGTLPISPAKAGDIFGPSASDRGLLYQQVT